jgi:hypothetical protein
MAQTPAPEANRFLVSEARKIIDGKDTVYFKRHYKDGRGRRRQSPDRARGRRLGRRRHPDQH